MDQSSHYRPHQPEHSKPRRDQIDSHRESDIPLDHPKCSAGKAEEMRDLINRVLDENNVCGLDRNIGSDASHGNTDAGCFESRGVIHTVTDHGSRFPAPLPFPQEFKFRFRKAVRLKAGDTL